MSPEQQTGRGTRVRKKEGTAASCRQRINHIPKAAKRREGEKAARVAVTQPNEERETRHTCPKRDTEMLPRLLSLTAAIAAADTGPTGAGVAGYMGIEGGVDAVPGRERCSSSSARRAVSSSTRWNICVRAPG